MCIARSVGILLLLGSIAAPAQWTVQYSYPYVQTTLLTVDALNDQVAWAGGYSGFVLRTTNGGAAWYVRSRPYGTVPVRFIRGISDLEAYAVAGWNQMYRICRTTDGGESWTVQYGSDSSWCEGLYGFGADTLVAIGGPVAVAAGGPWDVLLSENGGESWSRIDGAAIPPPEFMEWVSPWSTCAAGRSVWFTTSFARVPTGTPRIFRSTNGGRLWSAYDTPLDLYGFGYVAFIDDLRGVLASHAFLAGRGAWSTTDGGAAWTSMAMAPVSVLAMCAARVPRDVVFVVGGGGAVAYTYNLGLEWHASPTGRTLDLYAIDAGVNLIWAVGRSGEILRAPLNQVVNVPAESPPMPDEYALLDAYPNPFNPAAVIGFELPGAAQVLLEVTDLLGRPVTVLADARYPAGRHEVRWDASSAAAGVYLSRLEVRTPAGVRHTLVKKLVVLR